jgi:hypothetical protein
VTQLGAYNDALSLEDGKAKFQYEIEHSAGQAVLSVYDSRGQIVLVQEANKGVGSYNVDWNGKDAFGNHATAYQSPSLASGRVRPWIRRIADGESTFSARPATARPSEGYRRRPQRDTSVLSRILDS